MWLLLNGRKHIIYLTGSNLELKIRGGKALRLLRKPGQSGGRVFYRDTQRPRRRPRVSLKRGSMKNGATARIEKPPGGWVG